MEESDEDEEDAGGDEEASTVQQNSSTEQIECSGASPARTSDPTTAPPAGQLTLLEGPDCSMNGGHGGKQMFGLIHHRNKKTKEEPVPILGHGISTLTIPDTSYRYHGHRIQLHISGIRVLQILQIQIPCPDI